MARTDAADDALLLQVSVAERCNIADARKACDHATDAHALAVADQAKAAEARILAVQARQVAVARVARCEAALDRATKAGTTEDADAARTNVQQAKAESGVEQARLTLSDKQVAYAGSLATLAEEHIKVAMADVELAKVRAVNTLDRPDAQKRDVREFETSLRNAEGDENVARTRSEAAQREVAVAAANLEERQSAGAKP
jgi:hypothetical protein